MLNKRKLPFGGIITICFAFIYGFMFVYFGQDCFEKKNPKGFSEIRINEESHDKLVIGDHFFAGVKLNSGPKKDKFTDYIHLTFELLDVTSTPNFFKWEYIPLDAVPCGDLKIDIEKYDVGRYNLNNYLCPDTRKFKNSKIYGDWTTKNKSHIVTKISFCKRVNDELIDCMDPNKVKEYFDNRLIILNTIYPEVEYNINNPKNPFTVYFTENYNYISPNKYVFEEIHSSRYQLKEDVGFMFEDIEYHETYGTIEKKYFSDVRKSEEVYNKINAKDNNYMLYQSFFFYSHNKIYFFRSYMKIPDILARCGSILQILLSISGILYNIYAKKKFEGYLIKRLIMVEDEDIIGVLKKTNLNSHKDNFRNFFKIDEDINLKRKPSRKFSVINPNISPNKIEEYILNENLNLKQRESILKKNRERSKSRVGESLRSSIIPDEISSLELMEIQSKREKIKPYLESVIMKFREPENYINTNLNLNLKSIFCGDENIKKQRNFYNFYRNKFVEKMDIFYYMKQDKINKIIEDIIFNKEQNKIKDLVSKKNFTANFRSFDKNNQHIELIEDNFKIILEYLMNKGEQPLNNTDKELIKSFIL